MTTLLRSTLLLAHICGFTLISSQAEEGNYGEIQSVAEPNKEAPDSLLSRGVFDNYFDKKKLFTENTGFNYMVEYGALAQWGGSGGDNFHADHELNVIGMWDLFESPNLGNGRLLGWYQNSVTLGGTTTTEFMDSLGVLSPVNGGDTYPETSANRLQLLAWEQRLPGDKIRFMVGKLTTRVLMNLNRYAVSDREDFYSPMLVNNPVVPFTARIGLGVFGEYKTDDWYVSALFRDADASSDWIDFDSVSTGNWEYATEFGLTPEIDGLGQGNYRVMLYYTDAIGSGATQQSSGWSVSASFDQDFSKSLGGFFRYSYADNPLRTFGQRMSAGLQIKAPFTHQDDRLGFAAWWGDPVDNNTRDEYGLETFWRIQVTRYLQVSPDVQLIFNPSHDSKSNVAMTAGLRARLEF